MTPTRYLSISDSSLNAGAPFTFSGTVRDLVVGPSATTTTLRDYRSSNTTISTADTEVGTDAVGGLAASAACRSASKGDLATLARIMQEI